MRYYMAPMEGLTGYVYRNAYHSCFHNIDKYFSPFITAHSKRSMKSREIKDILPENNKGIHLVPQILTNDAQNFFSTQEVLTSLGYEEVNLNLGCPSATVTKKKKGAGFLAYTEELDRFLEQIFLDATARISVKTRIGVESPEEFERLLKVYNQYPLSELIIHPRTQKEFYNGIPHRDVFLSAARESRVPVCYNGDVLSTGDIVELKEQFQELDRIMIGRGVLRNPGLIGALSGNSAGNTIKIERELLRQFHELIYEGYTIEMSGEKNVLFRMKELWFYMGDIFVGAEKQLKKIRKTEHCKDYEQLIRELFQNFALREN